MLNPKIYIRFNMIACKQDEYGRVTARYPPHTITLHNNASLFTSSRDTSDTARKGGSGKS